MYIKAQTINQSIFFNFKSPLLYIWCIYVVIFLNICVFLQVDNLNLSTSLKNYSFYAMLITCKCTPFYKKLDCDVKSEPPYLVTTFASFVFTIACNHLGHGLHVDCHFPSPPFLVTFPCHCDLDLGGPSLAPLMFVAIHNPPTHDLHVDCHLLSPPSWLQLLVTLLVIVILILVVRILHLLCLQLLVTFFGCDPHVNRHFPFPPSWF